MKKYMCVLALFAATVCRTAVAQTDTITILHVNDTHSNLAPTGPRDGALTASRGGIARAATVIGMTRMTEPNVLVLHAGDVCIGDIFYNEYFGVPELQLMAAMGFDAMTVGNHEFDLTPSTLLTALETAFPSGGFPLLSANLILPDSTVQPLANYIQPYTIKQVGNIKVGIFGMTTPATNFVSQPAPAVLDTDIVGVASAMVDTLKARQCAVIICLSHLGIGLDKIVAQYVPGINLIVGGHDHYFFEKPKNVLNVAGTMTPIVQAGAFYLDMGKLQLSVSGTEVKLLSSSMIPLDASIPEEPTVAATVAALIAGIEEKYGPVFTQRIGYATDEFAEIADSLMSNGPKDTPVGNLVTDAFRAATGSDIAIEAGGSTAQPLYRGPVTADDVFRMVGYGFNTDNGLGYRLATFEMTGASIVAGLEFGLSDIEENDEYLIQCSGLTYTYSANGAPMSRLRSVTVNHQPVNLLANYTVTSNEFTLSFLDYLQNVVGLPVSYSNAHIYSDTTEFQVVSAYIASRDTITPAYRNSILSPVRIDGRDNARAPASFSLSQNYPNPFNPSTSIEFTVPIAAHVKIAVYDLLGKEVATLVNEQLSAGMYKATWNAAKAASGVYVYQLTEGNLVATNKMVLIR